MAAQSVSSASGSPHHSSTASSVDSVKSKRARTKHACDECRRSQKKCDGDKPLCRRCYLNGTRCTYTPHKSRSQCACIGQSEETHPETFTPDVYIFPDSSLGSFHTWSATSSPDQSPSASGSVLETSSPTNLGQDNRFGTAQNAVIEHKATAYGSPKNMTSSNSIRRGRHLYSHRSYSLPSFLNTSSIYSSPHATEFSTYPLSASLPHDLARQMPGMQEIGVMSSAHSALQVEQDIDLVALSTYDQFRLRHTQFTQGSAAPTCTYSASSLHDQETSARLDQGQLRLLNAEGSIQLREQQLYEMQQYAVDQCSQNSFTANPVSFPADYASSLDQPAHEYSSWPEQVHTRNVAPVPSHTRTSHEVPSAPQHIEYDDIGNAGHFIFGQPSATPGHFVSSTQLNGHDLTDLPSPAVDRRTNGTMLLHLPSPRFSHVHWTNEPVSPPLSGSYPCSVNPSPSAYGTSDFYDWSN
ncbi:uncharacterized protein FOMMEDRAFT_144289 [Fomitiporia mediterranea MF3/22]|uniref:uncharacterized protein n=1 Tax=Fomitiporia mediterranea (strain MF3/22) TaxID=694068 RepID=UPI0004407898|nr:uncharacterized protein FOMMEDRAFT_144289 [Fomitiporia mediterranea MF3/22]EJD08338.1 hypothetical protein FOMMEDRAFT_144289 [Fomitiporia mediterranea MF3/22]